MPRRSRRWVRPTGFALLVVGLAWLVTDRLLVGYLPLGRGGPDIGGGALFLLALAAVVVGVVLVVGAIWRGGRPSRVRAAGTGIGLVVVLALVAGLVVVSATRPGNPAAGLNGRVGVSVSANGSTALVLEICRGATSSVSVYGPHRPGAPNEVLARFDAAQPAAASVVLDVADPPTGWVVRPGASLSSADPDQLMIALGVGAGSELRQVAWTPAELRSLDTDTVVFDGPDGHTRVPRSTFHAVACG